MLEMEKTRLTKEIERADRRCAEIRKRLAEIEAKQHRLRRFVEKPHREARESETAAEPLPTHRAPEEKLKRRRLSY